MGELRDTSRTMCARVMVMCLVENMDKVVGEITEDQLNEEKELARRLSLMLGLDGVRNRDAMVLIHREGIQMALGQGREMVKLLVVLAEFSGKVLKQDRQVVVEYLNREAARCQGEEWKEVVIYRNSLLGGQREVVADQQ